MNLIDTFQDLVAQVPELVQPLIVAAAGAVPFIEGEGARDDRHHRRHSPGRRRVAAMIGNFLCVAVLVLLSSGARTAVVHRVQPQPGACGGAGRTVGGRSPRRAPRATRPHAARPARRSSSAPTSGTACPA